MLSNSRKGSFSFKASDWLVRAGQCASVLRNMLLENGFGHVQKNISQNTRLEHPNANASQSSYHTYRYSARRDCQIVSLNGIFKVENYHVARYLSTDQFSFRGCNFVIKLQKVSIFSLK